MVGKGPLTLLSLGLNSSHPILFFLISTEFMEKRQKATEYTGGIQVDMEFYLAIAC